MKQNRTLIFVLAAGAVGIVLAIWTLQEKEPLLGDRCLSLSAAVERSSSLEPDSLDYRAYADLALPPLSPEQSLHQFQIEEGFRIELVAHEPMIHDPVALDIDPDGRLWVIDMTAYNYDTRQMLETTGERSPEREELLRQQMQKWPTGRILILEDRNGDGLMDHYRIFYEGVLLPRSIRVLRDGVLLGEPPDLWFIRDTNGDGRGDSRERISADYTTPRSPQSGPSALLWGMDNWIHSSHFPSIRRQGDGWESRPFEPLGQWELSGDDWGRLFSSSNSWPLHVHLVPYGYSERHPLFELESGRNERVAPNGPMWPAHPTGVNRGYRTGEVTREDGTLKIGAGISSTVIYRGSQFGSEFSGNAFTPVAGGNLIKRILIDSDPAEIDPEVRFAYRDREFLTSTDERFRPVNITNAPDGTIYVIDMYRGLFDYVLWVTDYLRDYTLERDLERPTGTFGRIYRIVREDRPIEYRIPRFSRLTPSQAADHLRHKNGLIRDIAQQVLVECSPPQAVRALERLAADESAEPTTRLQALWTLEGYDPSIFDPQRLQRQALHRLKDPHPRIRAAAIRILEPFLGENGATILPRLHKLAESESSAYVRLQLLATLGESVSMDALRMMALLLDGSFDDARFREMALTGLYRQEALFSSILRQVYGWDDSQEAVKADFLQMLDEAAVEQSVEEASWLNADGRELSLRGRELYGICSACHGARGQGVDGIGSPLEGSDRVTGGAGSLIRIVLHGFDGGAAEQGLTIPNDMPSHGFLPDDQIASLLTYIRNAWGNRASVVTPDQVRQIRATHAGRTEPWLPEELRRAEP